MAAHQTQKESAPPAGGEVLSVSDRNPGVRTVRVRRPAPEEASFFPAALRGLRVTVGHFFRNIARGVPGVENRVETVQYPEEKRAYPDRNRGLHRLMKRDDGRVRCVACMCCPTVCPAHCITIIPAETDDDGIEKYPAVFEIDELRCVVCGLCVEACPCDAIRMDTGLHASSVEKRADGIMTRDELLAMGSKSVAVQGGAGDSWRESEPDVSIQPYQPRSARGDAQKGAPKKSDAG